MHSFGHREDGVMKAQAETSRTPLEGRLDAERAGAVRLVYADARRVCPRIIPLLATCQDASTAPVKATSSTHDVLTGLLGTSKQLVTAPENADGLDRFDICSPDIPHACETLHPLTAHR
jgi:hypothetical protein